MIGDQVRLDGTNSYDPDGDQLSYQWKQLGEPKVKIKTPKSPKPIIDLSSLQLDNEIVLSFALTVSDGQAKSKPSYVNVTVVNTTNADVVSDPDVDQEVPEEQNDTEGIGNDSLLNAEDEPVQSSEIHGQVYSDIDSDGERDSDEPGYANASLSLFGYGDTTQISLESRPYNVKINPATGLAYVGLRNSNMTIINPEDGELVATIPISAVAHIAFNDKTNMVYAITAFNGTVHAIDGSTHQIVASTHVPFSISIAVDPDRNIVYVTTSESKLYIIDGSTNEIVNSIFVPEISNVKAVNAHTGRVYLTSIFGGKGIFVYEGGANGDFSKPILGFISDPIVTNADTNKVYLYNIDNKIYVIDGTTHDVEDAISLPDGTVPMAISARSQENLLYILDSRHFQILVFDCSKGNALIGILPVRDNPGILAIDKSGDYLLVGSLTTATSLSLDKISLHGTFSSQTSDDGSFSFTEIPFGFYTLSQVLMPDGIFISQPAEIFYQLKVIAGLQSGFEFGNAVVSNPHDSAIRGEVFDDANADGSRGTNELQITNATIRLTPYELVQRFGLSGGPGTSVAGIAASNPETGLLYIANPMSDSIDVINAEFLSSAGTLQLGVGSAPSSIAINPTTNRIYILESGDGTVVVFDANLHTEQTRFSAPGVNRIMIDPLSNQLYMLNSFDNTMIVVDGNTNEIISSIDVTSPKAIVSNPGRSAVYLTTGSGQSLVVIDTTNRKIVKEIHFDSFVESVAVNTKANTVYVGLPDEKRIVKIDGQSHEIISSIENFLEEDVLAIALFIDSQEDRIYVASGLFDKIAVLDAETDSLVANIQLDENLADIVASPTEDHVYVISRGQFQGAVQILKIGSSQNTTSSSSDGSFEFNNLSRGNYSLTVAISGNSTHVTRPANGLYELEISGESEIIGDLDFGVSSTAVLGRLSVSPIYYNSQRASDIPIQVTSPTTGFNTTVIGPTTVALKAGIEYDVTALDTSLNKFSQWADDLSTNRTRSILVQHDENPIVNPIYVLVESGRVVRPEVVSFVLQNGTEMPAEGMLTVLLGGGTIGYLVDSGFSPKTYHLGEDEHFAVIAVDSEGFTFDHWIHPNTGEPVFNRYMDFVARSGLEEIKVVYRQGQDETNVVPVTSVKLGGIPVKGIFNKVILLSEGSADTSDSISDVGYTPNAYHVQRDKDYVAVAADAENLIFDHWEAVEFIQDETGSGVSYFYARYSNEFYFHSDPSGSVELSLVAVYREVPEEDFASVVIDTIGQNITVVEPTINQGVELTFEITASTGNVTIGQVPVSDQAGIFQSVSAEGQNATLTVAVSGANATNSTAQLVYGTVGQVVHINTAAVSLEGSTEVTLHYDPSAIPEGAEPRLLHFNSSAWQDVTISHDPDQATVTGLVQTFSPIIVGHGLSPDSKFGIGGARGSTINVESTGRTQLSVGLAAQVDVVIEFENVISQGSITVSAESVDEDKATVSVGSETNMVLGTVFEIDVSSLEYSEDITVTIPYDPDLIPAGVPESDVKFLHNTGNSWRDETVSVDTSANTVMGRVSSLSPVAASIPAAEDASPRPKGGGGGGNAPVAQPITPEVVKIKNTDTQLLPTGTDVKVTLKDNLTGQDVSIKAQNATSAGTIELSVQPTSDFVESFDNSTDDYGVSSVNGTKFRTVGKMYNITAVDAPEIVGQLEIAIMYDDNTAGELANLSPGYEQQLRLLQLGDAGWQDITVDVNVTSRTLTGMANALGPTVIGMVEDRSFGPAYFDTHPLSRISISNIDGQIEDEANQIVISAQMENRQRSSQTFTAVLQILDSQGRTAFIDIVDGVLTPTGNSSLSFEWEFAGQSAGSYTAKLMVLNELENPQMMSSVVSISMTG